MTVTMEEKGRWIKEQCLKARETDPIALAQGLMAGEEINIHGPEHHILDGACLLTALHRAGVEFDLSAALDEMMIRGCKMPGATCGQWGMCGSASSVGAALSILHGSGPLSGDEYYKDHLRCVAQCLEKIAEVGGPRCCKRNAYRSITAGVAFVREHYGILLPMEEVSCPFSRRNSQCLKERCPYYKGRARALGGGNG